jgi:hypothetical protein
MRRFSTPPIFVVFLNSPFFSREIHLPRPYGIDATGWLSPEICFSSLITAELSQRWYVEEKREGEKGVMLIPSNISDLLTPLVQGMSFSSTDYSLQSIMKYTLKYGSKTGQSTLLVSLPTIRKHQGRDSDRAVCGGAVIHSGTALPLIDCSRPDVPQTGRREQEGGGRRVKGHVVDARKSTWNVCLSKRLGEVVNVPSKKVDVCCVHETN